MNILNKIKKFFSIQIFGDPEIKPLYPELYIPYRDEPEIVKPVRKRSTAKKKPKPMAVYKKTTRKATRKVKA